MHKFPVSVSRAARLLAALKLRAAFNPDEARDEKGKWTADGVTGAFDTPISPEHRERVERRVDDMAEQMGFDRSVIDIVDKPPREFQVGNLNFKEAGHYNPSTNRIQINARMVNDDRMVATTAVVAHEIAHAQYAYVGKLRDREHAELKALPEEEYQRLFTRSGFPKPEAQAEIEKRWPASALMGKTVGDFYIASTDTHTEQLIADDGVSTYSRAYWTPEYLNGPLGISRAIDETQAEVRRLRETKIELLGDSHVKLSNRWSKLARGVGKIYAAHKAADPVRKR